LTTHAATLAPLSLPANELHVWLADPDRLDLAQLATRYGDVLSAEERVRYAGYRFDHDRRTYMAAHVLLRLTLARYTGQAPADVVIARGENRKPLALLPAPHQDITINLTHTRGQVGCVLARGRACGIDLESRPDPTALGELHDIARLVFAAPEIAQLERLEGETRTRYFFALWTLKEAYGKATGKGIIGDLTEVTFQLGPEHIELNHVSLDRLDPDPIEAGRVEGSDRETEPVEIGRAVAGRIGEVDAGPAWSFYSGLPTARHALGLAVRAPAGSLRLCCETLSL
jgi:4'-phosphopantetheinyl transferase